MRLLQLRPARVARFHVKNEVRNINNTLCWFRSLTIGVE
jgi:hypothetical protein